ncbi:MAG: VPDSG-CTERM sorting domain-containing protein [Verrucomicrobiales bacterium]
MINTDILWDGFVFAVGTGTNRTFRYASIIHGGPGALLDDGDDEINGVLGLNRDFTPSTGVPDAGATMLLFGVGLSVLAGIKRMCRPS